MYFFLMFAFGLDTGACRRGRTLRGWNRCRRSCGRTLFRVRRVAGDEQDTANPQADGEGGKVV